MHASLQSFKELWQASLNSYDLKSGTHKQASISKKDNVGPG